MGRGELIARSEFLLTRILNSEYAVKVGPAGDHRAVLRNLFRSLRPPHRWAHSPTMGGYPLHRQRERSRFRKAQTSLIGVAMSAESFADSASRTTDLSDFLALGLARKRTATKVRETG